MINFFGATDIGLVRKSNQDRFACGVISDALGWAVLCDGMGGHSGGNVASETTIRFVSDMLARDLNEDMTATTIRGILSSAAAGANALVYEAAGKDPELAKMGTTLVAAVYYRCELHICYVGDSRVYTVSPEKEHQLTKDHTVVQMLVDIGEITHEDAQSHPKRHYITRAIGVAPSVDADYLVHPLGPHELVLLCSDGLYNYLEPGMFYPLLSEAVRENSAQRLIGFANENGGADNVTAIVGVIGGDASNG